MINIANSFTSVILAGFLVGGYTIGAGVLGLPVVTGLAGFWPFTIAIICIWIAMYGCSWYLAKLFIKRNTFSCDYVTIFYQELGTAGKWIAIVGFFIIYYGALTAYLAGATDIVTGLFNLNVSGSLVTFICFIVYSIIIIFGLKAVEKGNFILMLILLGSFVYLVCTICPSVKISNFTYTDWNFLPGIFSVLLFAATPFLIVPSVCRSLNNSSKHVLTALIIGGVISFLISYIWTVAVMGVLPIKGSGTENLIYAFKHNLPATVPLAYKYSNSIFLATAVFSILAISTSYLGTGAAVMGFVRDFNHFKIRITNKVLLFIVSFIPSLFVTMYDPKLFIYLLNFVGGAGFCLVGGVIPALILVKNTRASKAKVMFSFLFLIFLLAIVLLELVQKVGLINFIPKQI